MSVTIDMFRNDAHAESFDTGQTIFQRGDQGEIMYVVTDGEVALSIGDRVLERVGPGGIFGEMALIEHKPRSATATATAPTKIAAVDQKRFLYCVSNTPFFALQVMQIMAGRIRRMDEAAPA